MSILEKLFRKHTATTYPLDNESPGKMIGITKIISKLSIFCIFMFLTIFGFSQNTIYIGTKSYSATKWWNFLNAGVYESWLPNSTLSVCFAKSASGGILIFSAETLYSDFNIGGKILIYMNDGSVISLSNRINKDHADGHSTVIYSLNSTQITNLKTNDILQIRYSIISQYTKDGFTAGNRHNISLKPGVYDERTYDTAKEISELLEK